MKLFDFNGIEDTSKLLRYRCVMLWIVGTCAFSSVSMMSGLVFGLAFGFRTGELIILGTCCAVSLTLAIPAIFCFAWIDEIEHVLTRRYVDFDRPIKEKNQKWVLKLMFWAVLVVLLPTLIRKLLA